MTVKSLSHQACMIKLIKYKKLSVGAPKASMSRSNATHAATRGSLATFAASVQKERCTCGAHVLRCLSGLG